LRIFDTDDGNPVGTGIADESGMSAAVDTMEAEAAGIPGYGLIAFKSTPLGPLAL